MEWRINDCSRDVGCGAVRVRGAGNVERLKGRKGMDMSEFVTDEACKNRSGEILAAVEKLSARLYKDNGTISIQTRLDRHEQSLRILTRLMYGAIALALVTLGKTLLAGLIRGDVV